MTPITKKPPITSRGIEVAKVPFTTLSKLQESHVLTTSDGATQINKDGIPYRVLTDEEGNVVVQAAQHEL